jgi:hypothetical protein
MNVEQLEDCLTNKKKKIVVGVVGSRRRNSSKDLDLLDSHVISLIRKADKANTDLAFVSGGCTRGADAFIKQICLERKLPLVEHLPKSPIETGHYIDPYWRSVDAYYARNLLIAKDCTFLIAMVAPDRTGGTENTISYCEEFSKKVVII